jgi:hypothetical protein
MFPKRLWRPGWGKRPTVKIKINGHSWRSRVAIMWGRLSNANRGAADVATDDEVEIDQADGFLRTPHAMSNG